MLCISSKKAFIFGAQFFGPQFRETSCFAPIHTCTWFGCAAVRGRLFFILSPQNGDPRGDCPTEHLRPHPKALPPSTPSELPTAIPTEALTCLDGRLGVSPRASNAWSLLCSMYDFNAHISLGSCRHSWVGIRLRVGQVLGNKWSKCYSLKHHLSDFSRDIYYKAAHVIHRIFFPGPKSSLF